MYKRQCLGQSIKQLYYNGRAFNFVNSIEQFQRLQKLEKTTKAQEQKIHKLENQLEVVLEKIDSLEQTCYSQNPFIIDSHKCFEIFKEKNIKMCLGNTRITSLEPPWNIVSLDITQESNHLKICIQEFELKGIVPCNDEEYTL